MKKNNSLLNKKPELVAPGGDIEKIKAAIEYGADAVYAGGEGFNLRMGASNLTLQDIKEATAWVHQRGKKIYITLNIYARNYHI
ncbi:MAG TPA: U32 family peptidase, partial [Candidatus Brocadiaceae bacterium]|nr:U32 family peptidase [Candidatus Brocadiaceae bacterium]